jgi:hypothetical protein
MTVGGSIDQHHDVESEPATPRRPPFGNGHQSFSPRDHAQLETNPPHIDAFPLNARPRSPPWMPSLAGVLGFLEADSAAVLGAPPGAASVNDASQSAA